MHSTIQASERMILPDLKGAMINRGEMLQGMAVESRFYCRVIFIFSCNLGCAVRHLS